MAASLAVVLRAATAAREETAVEGARLVLPALRAVPQAARGRGACRHQERRRTAEATEGAMGH